MYISIFNIKWTDISIQYKGCQELSGGLLTGIIINYNIKQFSGEPYELPLEEGEVLEAFVLDTGSSSLGVFVF